MNAPPPGLAMASHLPHLQETFTSLPPPPSHHASTTAGPLHPPPPPATASSAPTATTGAGRGKRKAAASSSGAAPPHSIDPSLSSATAEPGRDQAGGTTASPRPLKKSRTNTPWSPAEEQRLKAMRDAGSSWSDIAKVRPSSACRSDWSTMETADNWRFLLTSILVIKPDLPHPDRRKCQEALVQGMLGNHVRGARVESRRRADPGGQDMHYAEFAEDEVSDVRTQTIPDSYGPCRPFVI